MRCRIGFAAALIIAAGASAPARAAVIQTAAWTMASTAPPAAHTPVAPVAGETPSRMLSMPMSNDGAAGSGVFLETDSTGAVTLLPLSTIATALPNGEDDPGAGVQAGSGVAAADPSPCDVTVCTIAVDTLPFAVGSAAFEAGSFIGDAAAAVDYVLRDRAADGGGLGPIGLVGMGNFALLAVGLVGLALTRRRDHAPPG